MNLISCHLSLSPPYKAALQYTLHHKPSSQPLNDPRCGWGLSHVRKEDMEEQSEGGFGKWWRRAKAGKVHCRRHDRLQAIYSVKP
jgi:hypothetical protein